MTIWQVNCYTSDLKLEYQKIPVYNNLKHVQHLCLQLCLKAHNETYLSNIKSCGFGRFTGSAKNIIVIVTLVKQGHRSWSWFGSSWWLLKWKVWVTKRVVWNYIHIRAFSRNHFMQRIVPILCLKWPASKAGTSHVYRRLHTTAVMWSGDLYEKFHPYMMSLFAECKHDAKDQLSLIYSYISPRS